MLQELLVIDDADLHLSILRKIATQEGFNTTGARSVAEATQALRAQTFDCITLDLSLGDQSGIDILKLLADIKCRTPVIIISASDDGVREEMNRIGNFLDLNICPTIPKPINIAVLRKALKQIAEDTQRQKLKAPAGW
jgi:DNA-binding NtrC family response regulator